MVVACPFAQFDGTLFYDPSYVREYRKKLLNYVRSGERGFGLRLEGQLCNLNVEFLEPQSILVTYSIRDLHVSTTVSVNRDGQVVHSTTLTGNSSGIVHIDYTLDLSISVNRASYGQLTEGGPIPIPPSENDFQLLDLGKTWAIINENLDAMVDGNFYLNGQPIDLSVGLSEEVFHGKPASKMFPGKLQLHPGQQITAVCTFKVQPGITPSHLSSCPSVVSPRLTGSWKLPDNELGMIIRRNLEYILGNCTLHVEKGVCFITDHVALPLGWNRDN